MDWIMDIPSEVVVGFWLAIGSLITTIIGLITAVIIGAKRVVDAQAERQERDLKADAKREDMINAFAMKWEGQLEEKTVQMIDLQDQQRKTEVALAEERGKVIILQDTIKHNLDTWRKERQELIEKIDALEKRIAELEHEIQSKDELLKRKDELIVQLVKERDEYKAQLDEYNTKIIELTTRLKEEKEKREDCEGREKDTPPSENKITPLEQPEKTDDNEGKKLA